AARPRHEPRMKVSVLIPCYNGARVVGAAIDSALRQIAPPHEIIVVDDGSTDETASVLESYGSQIRLLRQENRGVAFTRKRLCAEASGDLLAFLDADDVWHPAYLHVQQRRFEAHPDVVALFMGHVGFYGYGAHEWSATTPVDGPFELIDPTSFLTRYNIDGT